MKRAQPRVDSGIAFVLALLLFLANPALGKCPTYSVQIHGKIECSFKADVKVVATLIFHDPRPKAFPNETPMNIHDDGTFDGLVAFNTYSSSALLSGDRCRRRPESVLIRLKGADGIEKDRTSLKIASDFNHDEKRGEYTARSDSILHGWCEAK